MSFADTWASVSEAEVNEAAYKDRPVDDISDGTYDMKVVKFDYFTTEKGEFHKWGLEVAGGLLAGKYVEKFGTGHPVSIKILKQDLLLVTGRIPQAHEVFDGQDTGPIKGELLGKVLNVKKATKKGYANYYFNEVLGQSYAETKAPTGESQSQQPYADDDSVPF